VLIKLIQTLFYKNLHNLLTLFFALLTLHLVLSFFGKSCAFLSKRLQKYNTFLKGANYDSFFRKKNEVKLVLRHCIRLKLWF